jgi:hypothetical protein
MKRQWILITATALTLVIAATISGCGSAKTETAIPAAPPAQTSTAAAIQQAGDTVRPSLYPLGVNVSGEPLFEGGLMPQARPTSQAATAAAAGGTIRVSIYPLGVNVSGLPLFEDGRWPQGATMSLNVPAPE